MDLDDNQLRSGRGWRFAILLSLLTSLAVVAPFFWLGIASGHDFEFHAASWLDVAAQWKEGTLFPRWAEWANYGFGEPRFIFYPPFSWLLGPALSLVLPWKYVPVAFIILVQTCAGLSAFALARRRISAHAALFAAVSYAANPYALLTIYFRSDYAELLACAFFPLLTLMALEITETLENRGRSVPRLVAAFAVVFAAVWLSNAPAGVLATYGAALLFCWAALTERSFRPWALGATALAVGFGLTGFYLIPAAYEQRWVHIEEVLSSGLRPQVNFLYTAVNDSEHTFFNWIASTIAVGMVVITGLAAVAAKTEHGSPSGKKTVSRALLLLAAAATFLMLRPAAVLWRIVPQLRFVQFPWRSMAILAVPFSYFLAAAVARRRFDWLWIIATIVVLTGTAALLVQETWWDSEDLPSLQAALANGKGFEGTDEYDPQGDDHYDLPAPAPQVKILSADENLTTASARVLIDRWVAEDRQIRVTSREPLRLELRLLNYPAWEVQVNQVTVTPGRTPDSAQMVIAVPAGESRVKVRFKRTADRMFGGIVSGAALLSVLAMLACTSRTSPPVQRRSTKGWRTS